jgi:hypothetical protein
VLGWVEAELLTGERVKRGLAVTHNLVGEPLRVPAGQALAR